jgi:cell division protein FtsI (penicillin-binding protein 3)
MRAFESVVSDEGTADQAMVDGLRIAGKTGTARKADSDGYIYGAYRATFVGFWPVEDPQVVIAIVMDEPELSMYGGVVAAPVFKRITERWMARMPQVAQYVHRGEGKNSPKAPITVPDVAGLPSPIAGRRLTALGLLPSGESNDYQTAVEVQNVRAGEELLQGVPVRLASAQDSTRVMPDVTGMSGREAMTWLGQLGVDVDLDGHGVVRRQSPSPGSSITGRARLTLN